MYELKIITCNANGLTEIYKQKRLSTYLNSEKPDIVCIQETNFTYMRQPKALLKLLKYDTQISSFGTNHQGGVTTILNNNMEVMNYNIDYAGRVVAIYAKLKIPPFPSIRITNIYSPVKTKERRYFINNLYHYMEGPGDIFYLCGDFNCVPDFKLDRINQHTCHQYDSTSFDLAKLVKNSGLVDLHRACNGLAPGFTFWRDQAGSRIDQIYAGAKSGIEAISCMTETIGPLRGSFSDHEVLKAVTKIQTEVCRKPIWRMDDKILEDPETIRVLTEMIKEWGKAPTQKRL